MDKHEHPDHSTTHTHDEHHPYTHSHDHKHTKAVLNRLARTSGHLKSISTMIEERRDCADVLIQLAAVRGAINKISEIILRDHLEDCILVAAETNDAEILDKLNHAIKLFLK